MENLISGWMGKSESTMGIRGMVLSFLPMIQNIHIGNFYSERDDLEGKTKKEFQH